MNDSINQLISELLHIDEGASNKLIDLEAKDISKTYYLSNPDYENLADYTIDIIKKRIGKPGNTILRNSSYSTSNEQRIGGNLNSFDWVDGNGYNLVTQLHKFIESIYKELLLKGNNPLFLSVGALKWNVEVKKDCLKKVVSPLLIFPIRLIRGSNINPIAIEFVDDDAYFNPCLYHRIEKDLFEDIAKQFPLPNGSGYSFDDPIDIERLDINAYFAKVAEYVEKCSGNDENTLFEFDPNVVAISHYNHNEICMYYDLKRNKDKIEKNSLVRRMFKIENTVDTINRSIYPQLILPADSVQQKMIYDVLSGKSMVIKGPPGTGKTLTIANMLVSLIGSGKSVLVSSKKLAALSEVYAKVPEKLRKFLLLLDSESEAEASKINPSIIKKELKEILDRKKSFSLSDNVLKDKNFAERSRETLINDMSIHVKQTFKDKLFFGNNYYEAADIFCKDDNIPLYNFPTDEILLLSRDSYNTLVTIIENMESHYILLSNNDAHTVYKCPWYGISESHKVESIKEKFNGFGEKMETIKEIIKKENYGTLNEYIDLISLSNIKSLIDGDLLEEQIKVLLDNDYSLDILNKNLFEYLKQTNIEKDSKYISKIENPIEVYLELTKNKLDRSLSKSDIGVINKCLSLFDNSNSNFLNKEDIVNLNNILKRKEELEKEIQDREFSSWKVFSKDITKEQREMIVKSNDDLSQYLNGDLDRPKALDFKSKYLIKKLKELCYLDSVTFKEIVNATNDLYLVSKCYENIKNLENSIQRIFQRQLDEVSINSIFLILKKSNEAKVELKQYVEVFKKYCSQVEEYAGKLDLTYDYKVSEVFNIYSLASKYQVIKNILHEFNKDEVKFDEVDPLLLIDAVKQINGVINLKGVINLSLNVEDIIDFRTKVKELEQKHQLSEKIDELINGLEEFGNNEFSNYYSVESGKLTINDFDIFISEIKNIQLIGSALKYDTLLKDTKDILNINDFFKVLERGELDKKGYSIKEIFEHSMYYATLIKYKDVIGSRSYDVGENMEKDFLKFSEQEEIIRNKNIDLIEAKLLSNIDPNSREFSFLDLERDNSKLRTLFKNHSSEILKLKRGLIVSPSTASILFSNEDYDNFDVVIIDEASQLEPVNILPVLYRSKQCVVVGDEWQMPPIEHFKAKNTKLIEDYEKNLEPDASALSVILKSGNFESTTLECHYRSKTESLIRFSQKKFYSNMKTFPSPIPKLEGLGFVDILAENATCSDGVNEVEANIVIEELKKLFDKYFIDERLTESIGIITFGEKQRDKIVSLINKDKELSNKISLAIQNKKPGIVDEKVIFYKTIEEVQGCEAEHIIISFTYGVDKNGKPHNHFGQLNRDKLGQCIFNVAVTRAQKSMTVIHSILARDINVKDNQKIAYIKEYLEISERFALEGKGQFVSSPVEKGFFLQVAKYLMEHGIEEDRIVFNYGVTEGSVKIPLVVLEKDKQHAKFGLFLERDLNAKYNYLDYNINYYDILRNNYGWKLQRVFISDWIFNKDMVKNKIKKMINDN